MSLKGKNAVITGSTSGIGLGFAKALAKQGVNLMINGLGDANEIEVIRVGLAKDHGVNVHYSSANMMVGSEIKGMVDEAVKAFGGIDILINNAGIQHVAPVDEFPDDKWEAIIRINLISAFYATKAALPSMKARGWGRVINLSSAHALVASPYKSAYVAAKHGISGFTKSVALEVAQQKITVNAIAPGYVWTPLVANQIPDTMKARGLTEEQVKRDVLLAAQPTKEFVTIEQVADLMLFLASESASAITGATYSIDGGWTAQ